MLYLCILGSNSDISRAEIAQFGEEKYYDAKKNLALVEFDNIQNPRGLPKAPEQILLDRLGGTIRIAKFLGEFKHHKDIIDTVLENFSEDKTKIGLAFWGTRRELGPQMGDQILDKIRKRQGKVRIENPSFRPLTSGEIFDRKLLKKGDEFIIWQNGDSFLLAQTVANQNLRNYTLRDHRKPFRDAKMGMLPPKLAQVLINLATTNTEDSIIDPFCGSGTIGTEAAIMGFEKIHLSDLNPDFIKGTNENIEFLSSKFRFESSVLKSSPSDVLDLNWQNKGTVLVTEGYMGTNFERRPPRMKAEQNKTQILGMWEKIFPKFSDSVKTISMCLPHWNTTGGEVSMQRQFLRLAKSFGYEPRVFLRDSTSFLYERKGAYVSREIVVLDKVSGE